MVFTELCPCINCILKDHINNVMSKKWARLDLENSTFDLCVRSICNKYCDQGKLSRVAKLFKIVFIVRIRKTHRQYCSQIHDRATGPQWGSEYRKHFNTKLFEVKYWFKLLSKNLKANILVNGFTTESINIEQSVKQGDPPSCSLFMKVFFLGF